MLRCIQRNDIVATTEVGAYQHRARRADGSTDSIAQKPVRHASVCGTKAEISRECHRSSQDLAD
mgnify:CR=1 FL=1